MLRYPISGTNRIIGRAQINVGGANKYVKAMHYGQGSNRGVHYHQFSRGTAVTHGEQIGGIRLFRCRPGGLGSYTVAFGDTIGDLSTMWSNGGASYYTSYQIDQLAPSEYNQYTLNGDPVNAVLVSVDGGAFWDELTWTGSDYRKDGTLGGSGWPDLDAGVPPPSGSFSLVVAYAP